MSFQNPIDVCNVGMQHIGATRVGNAGFAEDSVQASECSFAYDKLRQAELRRNAWRFAIKLCPLRPLSQTSMQINPPLWASGTTYFIGSLVTDALGATWQSLIADNLGQSPGAGAGSAWEQYFGPLVCDAWTPNLAYYAGDVVYVAPGDGTYLVFVSTMQSNGVSPTIPAVWLAGNIYFKDQVVTVFPAWAIGTTYGNGATVIDSAGNLWSSIQAGNIGHTPATGSAFWTSYPPPAQYPGGTQPNYQGYLYPPSGGGPPALTGGSQQSQTTGILEWSSVTTYSAGTIVDYKGLQYVSIGSAANLNLVPPSNAASWAPIIGGTAYQSLVDLNTNQPPATSPTAWTTTLTESATNGPQWLELPNIYLTKPALVYPIGSGPLNQSDTRNVFQLPANYLRKAAQDPKAGSTSYLGAPSGRMYDDWEIQGNYIVTRCVEAINFRFVADTTLVTSFDPMFCEGLGARVGAATCMRITQSDAKVQICLQEYQKWMTEARIVNGIETGAEEPAEDDFIAARL